MKKLAALAVCGLSLGAVSLTTAAPAKKAAPAKTMNCTVCKKMALTTRKTKTNTRMVKVNGKTMYCCPTCRMKTDKPMKMQKPMKSPAKKMQKL